MPLICVLNDGAGDRAGMLAAQLDLPLITGPQQAADAIAVLEYGAAGLQLRPCGGRSGPIAVDFTGGANRYRLQGGTELIAKAVRGRAKTPLRVLDATAGLGRDAFVLAARGFTVTLLERSPVVAALLADGIRRAHEAGGEIATIAARMALFNADAVDWLPRHAGDVDVICLDPMFPESSGSALAKKEMQLFQQLALDGGNEAALLQAACASARLRVVVKRPLRAPPLAERRPAYALTGRAVRFDVYTAPPRS